MKKKSILIFVLMSIFLSISVSSFRIDESFNNLNFSSLDFSTTSCPSPESYKYFTGEYDYKICRISGGSTFILSSPTGFLKRSFGSGGDTITFIDSVSGNLNLNALNIEFEGYYTELDSSNLILGINMTNSTGGTELLQIGLGNTSLGCRVDYLDTDTASLMTRNINKNFSFSSNDIQQICNITLSNYDYNYHYLRFGSSNQQYYLGKLNIRNEENELPYYNISYDSPICVDDLNNFESIYANITIDDVDIEGDTIYYATRNRDNYYFNETIRYSYKTCSIADTFICRANMDFSFYENTIIPDDYCDYDSSNWFNSQQHNLDYYNGYYMLELNGNCIEEYKEFIYNLEYDFDDLNYYTEFYRFEGLDKFNISFYDNNFNPVSIIRISNNNTIDEFMIEEWNGTEFKYLFQFSTPDILDFKFRIYPNSSNQSYIYWNDETVYVNLSVLEGVSSITSINEEDIEPLYEDTIAEYHFEEFTGLVKDSSNTYDLTAYTGLDRINNGYYGNSYLYDGTDDYLERLNTNLISSKNQISISTWIYPIESKEQFILSFSENGKDDERLALRLKNDEFIEMWSVSSDADTLFKYKSTTGVSLNEWNNIIAIYDYIDDSMTLYVNGELSNYWDNIGFIANITDSTTSDKFYVGLNTKDKDDFFKGFIDETFIVDYALENSDVIYIYENTHLLSPYVNTEYYYSTLQKIRYIGITAYPDVILNQKFFTFSGVYSNPEFTTIKPTQFLIDSVGMNYFDLYITDSFHLNTDYNLELISIPVYPQQYCIDTGNIISQEDNVDLLADFEEGDSTGIGLLFKKFLYLIQFPYRIALYFGFLEILYGVSVFLIVFGGYEFYIKIAQNTTHPIKNTMYSVFFISILFMFMKIMYIPLFVFLTFITMMLLGKDLFGSE